MSSKRNKIFVADVNAAANYIKRKTHLPQGLISSNGIKNEVI
jgi:hypothetical protein